MNNILNALIGIALIALFIFFARYYKPSNEMQKLRKWRQEDRANFTTAYPMVGTDLYWHAWRIGAIDNNLIQKAKEQKSLHRVHKNSNKHRIIKDPDYYADMSIENVAMHMAGFRTGPSGDYEYRIIETRKHSRNTKKQYTQVVYCRYMTNYAQVVYMPAQKISKWNINHLNKYCLSLAYDANNPKDYLILNK